VVVVGAISVLVGALATAVVVGFDEDVDDALGVGWMLVGAAAVLVGLATLVVGW
jgi:hypothetical protein